MDRYSSLQKGYICVAANTNNRMDFQYNPEEFTDDKSVEYASIKSPGMQYPKYAFVGGNDRPISFTLFLDAYEDSSSVGGHNKVRRQVGFLHQFLTKENSNAQFVTPPVLIFAFGWFVKKGILVSAPTRYTMFDRRLNPIRAEVDVTINIIG